MIETDEKITMEIKIAPEAADYIQKIAEKQKITTDQIVEKMISYYYSIDNPDFASITIFQELWPLMRNMNINQMVELMVILQFSFAKQYMKIKNMDKKSFYEELGVAYKRIADIIREEDEIDL